MFISAIYNKGFVMESWFNIFSLVFTVSVRSFWIKKSFWIGIIIFALCLLILFPFSLGTQVIKRPDVQIGCLWAIMEFVAALCISRMFTTEQEANALDILLCSRSSRWAILFAKICFTALLIFSLQIPILFFWMFFFNVDFFSITTFVLNLFFPSIFFSFGSAAIGAFVYGLTVRSLAKEILQPILFFPLQTALLLASVSISLSANSLDSLSSAFGQQAWWTILVLYPVIFSTLGWIFSFMLLEE
ncbi:MAG: heme exporter protein CcmB [Bdellovibrionota bacterium]